jgi:hypothetical protein
MTRSLPPESTRPSLDITQAHWARTRGRRRLRPDHEMPWTGLHLAGGHVGRLLTF